MSIVDFINSDLININDINCDNIGTTGAINPLLYCGISGNNVTTNPSGYFDPWNSSIVRKGIDFDKFSEYLEWGDSGTNIGGFTGGWICIKPVVVQFHATMMITQTATRFCEGYYRKYDSSLNVVGINNLFAGIDSTSKRNTLSFSKLDYLDIGDKVQIVFRNISATTCKTSISILLIKDGTNVSYTDIS